MLFTKKLHEQAGVHEASERRQSQLPVELIFFRVTLDDRLQLMMITEEQHWNRSVRGVHGPKVGFLRHSGFVNENGVGTDRFADTVLTSREQGTDNDV